jgi:hypothetical protein
LAFLSWSTPLTRRTDGRRCSTIIPVSFRTNATIASKAGRLLDIIFAIQQAGDVSLYVCPSFGASQAAK